MRFVGEDNSVLDVEDTGFHMYWAKEPGIRFRDISFDDKITIIENLWICGLRSSTIDAIDIYQIYRCRFYKEQNLKVLKQLYADKAQLRALEKSLKVCDNLSKPALTTIKHHINSLRNSINTRQQVILQSVIVSTC